ncbi:bifunctional riboflavin kinase/FAD synthetase [Microbacterium sp. zg.Y1090]|uniref:bifunctional riboflavin kinase/FAD synthetase n=1 Tax=Microbacterium TaxID=33882 RepID=UPI00214BEBA5|nr:MULTISPECIES: bifunctional riboflavin kinase/FAD synthetase [unclassified Microbacterium]MCR2813434.1 bifunctional riboflavin kinase/FAD synthetase [Microbacterium sp. zg.Y1084]MCR2818230.1 bifunctional riboflavin kinase/FAD synthetase [Microbacterium sp. zg.Y1090]MDL5486751.1 bifunctional riboflavin kinase/FAD synthetase [Microbacterium sp. zg-Y1211]WIM27622.1 bifunctional riboflavin kinase/FAD synthetase [Microbacterium sp. zg-Y1090]
MIVFRDPAEIPAGFGPSVVVIGKFDGVHAGHRAGIDRARVAAEAEGARVVAVTFDRNPLSVLRPELCPPELVSVDQKLALLAQTGVDATLVLHFDRALADLPAEDFVRRVLVDAVGAVTVFVGADFRFGRGGAGDPGLLAQLGRSSGFRVEVIDDIRARDDGRRVSSTWIRGLLAEGDVEGAARLLGRPAAVRGEVVHGLKRGRDLGFPTANLSLEAEGFIPADGVYAGWLVDEGAIPVADASPHPHATTRYPAAISVGTNPTFGDVTARQVEAYVLDETDLDLYGHRVEVHFTHRIRGMVAFEGVDALIAQMTDDVARVRAALSD